MTPLDSVEQPDNPFHASRLQGSLAAMAAKGNALAVWPQADRTLKLECVFGNNSHFSRAFKAAFGRRPSGAHSARIVTRGCPEVETISSRARRGRVKDRSRTLYGEHRRPGIGRRSRTTLSLSASQPLSPACGLPLGPAAARAAAGPRASLPESRVASGPRWCPPATHSTHIRSHTSSRCGGNSHPT